MQLDVAGEVTQRSVLDALESPATRCCAARSATSRTLDRRAFVRFFACEEDLSHDPPDAPLPDGGRLRR
ncbi:MAG: hypothetical protein WKF83_16620 [Nocardioidaceae bacterium]